MGDRAGWLGEDEAAARVRQLDAAAAILLDDVEVIRRWIVTAQGELEAALAGQRAMAGPGVAAELGQHGLDVGAEAPLERAAHARNDDLSRRVLLADLGRDRGLAVMGGDDQAIDNGGDLGIARRPGDLLGDLTAGFVALELLQDQALPAFSRGQLAPGWQQREILGGRGVGQAWESDYERGEHKGMAGHKRVSPCVVQKSS